jgi:hypothetical protein
MKRLLGIGALATALAAAGCGSSVQSRIPSLAAVPLVPGSQVLAHETRCDRGANPYCAVQLVVAGRGYTSSAALLVGERRHLKALGWSLTNADTGDERAAESPGHKLRLTFATAARDLKDVDLGWVRRSRTIARTLAETMFDRVSALSLMLESGSS